MSIWLWSQLIGFQLFWLAAVAGGNQWIWLCIVLLMLHFFYSPTRLSDLSTLPLAFAGMTVDSLFTLGGFYAFDQFPVWLGLLWIGFLLTLGHCLAWLRTKHLAIISLLGAVGGTSSYIAGWRLDAVNLPKEEILTFTLVAMVWALLLPAFVKADQAARLKFKHLKII